MDLIASIKSRYSHVLIRLALERDNNNNVEFGFCRIDFDNVVRASDEVYDYGNFVLIRRTVDVTAAIGMLETIKSGTLKLAGFSMPIQTAGSFYYNNFSSGMGRDYVQLDWPSHYFSIDIDSSPRSIAFQPVNHRSNLPPYPTKNDATVDFIDLSHNTYFEIRKSLLIVLPDYRARIKQMAISSNEIQVEIEAPDYSFLAVQFYCTDTDGNKAYSKYDMQIIDGKAKFDAGFEPGFVQATLIDLKTNKRADQKSWGGRNPKQKGVVYHTPERRIRDLISMWENSKIEFKSEIGDKELLESVVSFANTEGGTIIVGVNNQRHVIGLFDNKESVEKKVEGLIKARCEPTIDYSIEWQNVDGKPLLLIHVVEGKRKPYLLRDRGIYIRERDHDYLIDRNRLDEIYRNNKSGS